MKVRFTLRILLVLALSIFLPACSDDKAADATEPVSDGFSANRTLLQGGGVTEGAGDYNAKTMAVTSATVDGVEETHIEFTFVSGSRISGGEEEQAGAGVPSYTVYALDAPARLVVELDNLAHWDYRRTLSGAMHPLILSSFQHIPADSTRVSIYFQLEAPVRYLVETEGDMLRIRLRPQANSEQPQYFVTVNAYDDYRTGELPSEVGLTPTLASDLENILLISSPYATQDEAETYKNTLAAQYGFINTDAWRVLELAGGALPPYERTLDYLSAYQTPAVRLDDGQEVILPVIVPDGLYLTELPDGNGILYSRTLAAEESDGTYQQLYVLRNDGQSMNVTGFEFTEIEEAKFSPDGRRLAVLERTSASTHLYVFDASTYELLNDLSEMGFGGSTSAFIWNSLGNTIYAITGTSSMQLHQFDYSIPNEQARHSIVDANSLDEGSLGYCDGELYFSHATMEDGSTIYRIKPEGGVRKPFLPGERFAISSDEKYMAIVSAGETSQSAQKFELYEFSTGAMRTISDEVYPYDFLWSKDCTKVFYTESRISGGQTEEDTSLEADPDEESTVPDETAVPEDGGDATAEDAGSASEADPYPYTLWMYDVTTGTNTRLFDMSAPYLFPSSSNSILYLCRTDDALSVRATYILNIETVLAAPVEEAGETPDVGTGADDVFTVGE